MVFVWLPMGEKPFLSVVFIITESQGEAFAVFTFAKVKRNTSNSETIKIITEDLSASQRFHVTFL